MVDARASAEQDGSANADPSDAGALDDAPRTDDAQDAAAEPSTSGLDEVDSAEASATDPACLMSGAGSRLQRVGYLGDDGSWEGRYWYDTELESPYRKPEKVVPG